MNEEGTIIIRDEEITVEEPVGLGRYPRITPGKNVRVYVDGELIKEETVISEASDINIEKEEITATKELSVRITDDGLKAYLQLLIEPELELKIKDTGPANSITVETEIINKNYPDLTEDEIYAFLQKHDITYGLKEEAIRELVKNMSPEEILIAEGNPPSKGEDARVVPAKINEQNLADSFKFIDSFSRGEIIAYRVPPKPGKPGIDVRGREIPVPPVKDVTLAAGRGVILSLDKQKAIAVACGMPTIKKEGEQQTVSISPRYVIDGDIDINTGNLKYEGDLVVTGNIKDYYDVMVGNNLQVHGNIANAEVRAMGNVLVKKNIISSKILVGLLFGEELRKTISSIGDETEKLLAAAEQIMGITRNRKSNFSKNYQLGRVINLLLNQKFPALLPNIRGLYDSLKNADLHSHLKKCLQEFLQQVSGYKKILQLKDLEPFVKLNKDIKKIRTGYQDSARQSSLYTGYIQNSIISSSGDVIITEKGCYNSEINAAGDIIAFGRQGFLRGGTYNSGGKIYVRNIGSGFSKTGLKIETGIYAREIKGCIILKAPAETRTIDPPYSNLYLTVDDEGKLRTGTDIPAPEKIKEKMKHEQIPAVREGKQ